MSGTSATADMAGGALPFVLCLIAGSTDNHRLTRPMGYSLPTSPAMRWFWPTHIVVRDPAILSYILSVPVFILILFLTRVLAGGLERTGVSMPRPLLLLQLFFLIALLAVCVVASPRRAAAAVLAVTADMFGVAAMAVQNALVQISLTNTPTTAVMTTNITHFMLGLGEVLVGRDRARLAHARACASASLVHDRLVGMAARRWADLDWSALGLLAAVDAGLANRS